MYARCFRRSVVGRLPRRLPVIHAPRRCLSAVEATPTTDDTPPPPPNALPELERDIDNWIAATNSSPIESTPLGMLGDDPLTEVSKTLRRRDDSVPDENARKQTKWTSSSLSICVVPELRVLHMRGILALLRELEQKFGLIREFRFLRDKDSPADYMKAFFIKFYHEESVEKVRDALRGKQAGMIMVGPPSEWDRKQELDGGVGLEDIQTLLRPVTPKIQAVEGVPVDGQMDNASGSVEEASESEETSTSPSDAEDLKRVPPATSVDAYECRIEIREDDFRNYVSFNDRDRSRTGKERQVHMSRSLVQWAGFYPHYHFSEGDKEKDLGQSDTLPAEERQKMEIIRLATRDMKKSILRHRTRLYDLGEPDHGLTLRDGKRVVAAWEMPPQSESVQKVMSLGQQEAEPVDAQPITDQAETTNTNLEKPRRLTPEERILEQSFALSDQSHSQADKEPAPKTTKFGKKTSIPVSSPPPPPRFTPRAPATSPPQSKITNQLKSAGDASSTEASAPTGAAPDDSQEGKEAENNRERRARKKAEQERAGFKSKLLGWLGR